MDSRIVDHESAASYLCKRRTCVAGCLGMAIACALFLEYQRSTPMILVVPMNNTIVKLQVVIDVFRPHPSISVHDFDPTFKSRLDGQLVGPFIVRYGFLVVKILVSKFIHGSCALRIYITHTQDAWYLLHSALGPLYAIVLQYNKCHTSLVPVI